MRKSSPSRFGIAGAAGLTLVLWASAAAAQTVTVTRNVNLRSDPSSEYDPIRLLTPAEPPMTLAAVPSPPPGPGIPGSASMVGCGDARWQHVYNPSRLLVKQDCVTVTGTIVDATASQSHHQADGMRHEGDGDTHGWLKVDPAFATLINAGNTSDEEGNLVFEIVCHYTVKQADAKPTCSGFVDHTVIPAIGTHVAVKGTFVQEKNHKKWNEIHPVSSIKAQP
jgi:hypothetical protein